MYISLGGTCAVSNQIKNQKHHKTLPFDWTKITLGQLKLVLKNDFKNYTDIIIHKYSDNHNSYILKNNYNIRFAHEVEKKYTLNEFKKKLENRILKFNKILSETKDEIKFIRFETAPYKQNYFTEFIELLNIIHKKKKKSCNIHIKLILHKSYYDKLDFFHNKIKINLNLYTIKTYFYDDFSQDWKYPNINWYGILKE